MVFYCDPWMSVIHSQQLLQRTLPGWVLTKLGRNDPYMVLLNNCSNGFVCCISRSHRLEIDC